MKQKYVYCPTGDFECPYYKSGGFCSIDNEVDWQYNALQNIEIVGDLADE